MMGTIETKRRVQTLYTVTLTEAEVEKILREAVNAPADAKVQFDIGGDGWLRDEAVEISWMEEATQ